LHVQLDHDHSISMNSTFIDICEKMRYSLADSAAPLVSLKCLWS
jgi:hypothetical protein